MSTHIQLNGNSGFKHFKVAGEGTESDPFVPEISAITNADEITSVNNLSVTIGTTSTQVLNVNSSRKLLILTNDSDEDIYISLGDTATLNSGIRLNKKGGTLILDDPKYTGIVNAICLSGNKQITGVEG